MKQSTAPMKVELNHLMIHEYNSMFVIIYLHLMFVIFDVETVFLYPWAVAYEKLGIFALVEMLIFAVMLVIGLIYAWKKKVLKWS